MELRAIVYALGLKLNTQKGNLTREITGVYVSDLLSDVLAHAKEGDIWVTLQCHPNIVAVASMKDISGIVLVNGRIPDETTVQKANEEAVPILTSEKPAFELAGRLYMLLEES
jgi:hypothetical protein